MNSDLDLSMMRRCIDLSAAAGEQGELPFAALICHEGKILAESINRVVRDGDVTRHAEVIIISETQKRLGRRRLTDCTLYSNIEPCAMCSFPIRESRIGRVVFALGSPLMGGQSKWNILGDREISESMPQVFGGTPEVVAGLMAKEAAEVWRRWNPLIWEMVSRHGMLREQDGGARGRRTQDGAPAPSVLDALFRSRPSLAHIWHAIRLSWRS